MSEPAAKPLSRQSLKLRKGRRTTFDLPRGCRLVIEGRPSHGKPAILVEYPAGTNVTHETLTPDIPGG